MSKTPIFDVSLRARGAHAALTYTEPSDNRLAVISRLPLFAGIAQEKLANLASRSRWQVHGAGETIVYVSDTTDEVFVIAAGGARVVLRTTFGYESILNDLGVGNSFGELTAIDRRQRSANVTALVHTRLCVIPGAAFMDLVLSSAEVGHRLLVSLSSVIRSKDERLIEFGALTVRQRLIAELLRLSRSRTGRERVISPPPPQHILAARVGTRRESVSREMADMARSGLLTVGRGGIILHRPDQLRADIEARLQGSGFCR